MAKNPFKILNSFEKDDFKFFGGRENETRELYELITSGNIVAVFGESGVGKTSLVQCGLANRFIETSWLNILVRKGDNINASLRSALWESLCKDTQQSLGDRDKLEISLLVKEAYLDNFKPVYLIFDQFEDLYTIGTPDERIGFYNELEKLISKKVTCKIIFVIRDDYYARLHEMEKKIQVTIKRGLEVNPMPASTVNDKVVQNYLEKAEITSLPNIETISQQIVAACAKGEETVFLPYLQVYLHTLWEKAHERNQDKIIFDESLITEMGKIENVLRQYLEDCVTETDSENSSLIWSMLYQFVSPIGTKQPCKLTADCYSGMGLGWANTLETKRILTRLDENQFELAHESLVAIIQEKKPKEDTRPRLEIPKITGNPYKGLGSFEPEDFERFFGRENVVKDLIKKINENSLVAIVGPSGCGKSSITKAGVIPELKERGYHTIIVKPGTRPDKVVEFIKENFDKAAKEGNILLFIDQFEELNTRAESVGESERFLEYIKSLLAQNSGQHIGQIKIVLSVRQDYEQEFDSFFPDDKWEKGKFNMPPFGDDELRLAITEPAYLAGLEFSPAYLVDTIVRDTKKSNGTLPLLSFALSQMYDENKKVIKVSRQFTEEMYNKVGGVIGGLENRADEIVRHYPSERTVRNIMLRMVASGAGELTGKRVYRSELNFPDDKENKRVSEILAVFIKAKLVVASSADGKPYVEPAHDALIRNWKKVRQWTKENEETLYLQRSLAAVLYDNKYTYLWHDDPRINQLKAVQQSDDNWLNVDETDFVERSLKKKRQIKRQNYYNLGIIGFIFLALISISAKTILNQSKSERIFKEREAKLYTDSIKAKNDQLVAQDVENRILLQKTRNLLDSIRVKDSVTEELNRQNRALMETQQMETLRDLRFHQSHTKYLLAVDKENKKKIEIITRQTDSLSSLLARIDLQKEYFYQSNSFGDSLLKERYIDTLLALKLTERDMGKFENLKRSLNLIAEANNESETNPNTKFNKALESYHLSHTKAVDSIALKLANGYLFYKQRMAIAVADSQTENSSPFQSYVSSLFTSNKTTYANLPQSPRSTVLSSDQSWFAANIDNRIVVGRYMTDSISYGKEFSTYKSISENKLAVWTNSINLTSNLYDLKFSNNNQLIGVSRKRIFVLNSDEDKPDVISLSQKKKKGFFTAVISPNGKRVVTNHSMTSVKTFSLANPKRQEKIFKIDKSDIIVQNIEYSPDGDRILVETLHKYWVYDFTSKVATAYWDLMAGRVKNVGFTPDSKHIIYNVNDSVVVINLDGTRFSRGLRIIGTGTISRLMLSPDWKALVVQTLKSNKSYSSELYESINDKSLKDSIFTFSVKRPAPSLSRKSFIGDGNFGFLSNNSMLSYTINSANGMTIFLNKNYPHFTNFLDASKTVTIPKNEDEIYALARSYYDQGISNYYSGSFNNLPNLFRARSLYEELLSMKSRKTQDYLATYKLIYNAIFRIDSNYQSLCDGLRKFASTGEELLVSGKTILSTRAFRNFEVDVSYEYGRLAWYLLFTPKVNYDEVVAAATRSLELEPVVNDWVNTNLALGYLFTRQYSLAASIYKKFVDRAYYTGVSNFRESFLEDLGALRRKNIISARNPEIKQRADALEKWLLKETKTLDPDLFK